MKRTLALFVFTFLAVSASAGQTRRYVVGVSAGNDEVAVASRAVDAPLLGGRHFRVFRNLGGFAADLTDAEAATLRGERGVRFVEASMPVYAFNRSTGSRVHKAAPAFRDPNIQTTPWGVANVDAPATWIASRGDAVNVAIIDTGIDYTHPDLKDEYAGGVNVLVNSTDPMDDNGHGTHVAGTIAAADNAVGVVGVAPHARLWSAKVLASDGSGSTADIASAIDWVIGKKEAGGNWIINMSLGICSDPTDFSCAPSAPQTLVDACQRAADAGILIFAAAGNDSAPGAPAPVAYPAAFPTVVAVGAVDATGTIADFSNQGPEMAVVAPGVDILSTFPVGQASNSYIEAGVAPLDAGAIQGSKMATVSGKPVFCGFGGAAAEFPAEVKGNIAVIERGNNISFNEKTKNALTAGAAGVVIYNCSMTAAPDTCANDADFTTWTLITTLSDGTQDPADLSFDWPVALGVSNETGLALRAMSSTVTEANTPDDYTVMSGTSMASPHAAGVAALIWSAAPNAAARDVKQAMLSTAQDLGAAGQDPVYGFGLLDAMAAAKTMAPQLFGSGNPPKAPPTGRPYLKRGH